MGYNENKVVIKQFKKRFQGDSWMEDSNFMEKVINLSVKIINEITKKMSEYR